MSTFNAEQAFNHKSLEVQAHFNEKDAIIYALGLGFSRDPMNTKDLRYTFEMNENFSVFPTYACVLNKDINLLESIQSIKGVPEFNPMMLLHGEQTVDLFRPLTAGAKYVTGGELYDIDEKAGKGTTISYKFTTYEVDNNNNRTLAFTQIFTVFVRKLSVGGFKGIKPKLAFPQIPKRTPDHVYEEQTRPEQAILYRLNGDYNPLHIDPSMAAMGGFKQPILHGLCFYGLATKAVSETLLNGNSDLVTKIQCRFTSSVFPGETLQFSVWKESPTRAIVTGKTVERGHKVIQGYVDFKLQPKL